MPTRDLMLRVLGDTKNFDRAMNSASASSKQLEKHVGGLEAPVRKAHTALLGMATGMLGAGGVVFGLESMITAAKNAQESQGHLAITMKDAGLNYDANKASIEGLIKKQSELAGFQQTDLRESYARLIASTKDVKTANVDLALATDIARGRHISLEAATQLVTKANLGMTGSLRRMGIDIKPVHDAVNALTDSHLKFTTAQKDAAKALDLAATKQSAIAELQKRYAGQAAEYGKSSAGAADKFKVSLTNLEITLGTALLPTLTKGLTQLSKWINHLNDSGQAAKYAHEAASVLSGVIHDGTKIVEGAVDVFDAFSHAVGGSKNALEILGGAIIGAKVLGALKTLRAELLLVRDAEIAAKLGALGPAAVIAAAAIPVASFLQNPNKETYDTNSGTVYRSADGKWRLRSTGSRAKPEVISGKEASKLVGHDVSTTAGTPSARNAVTIATAPFSNVPYQWGGGHGATPGPSFSSGHGRSGLGLDCSGYARAVLANMGISVNGNADALLSQAKSHPGVNQLMPGDLVFYEGVHPGHVMVYIGGGQVIGETHTGASGPEVHSVNYMSVSGTGRYTGVKGGGDGGSSTKAGGIVGPSSTSSSSIADILAQGTSKKGKPHHHAALTGSHLLSTATQIALADASGTKGTADDLTALTRAKNELSAMPHSVAVANEIGSITKRINAITAANTRAHLAAQSAEYKKHATAATAELKNLDAAWKKHGDMLRKQADEAKQIADRSFTEAESEMFKQFDRLTSMGMKNLESERKQLTPIEQQLYDLQLDHQKQADAQALTDKQAALDQAHNLVQNAGETDDQFRQRQADAIKQAETALSDELYQQKVTALQQQADAERVARDQQFADKEQAYQDQRDLDRQKLQDWLADQKTALDDGRTTWDTFYADLQKKATAGGFDVGKSFWDAWHQAATDNASATSAGNQATAASSGGPEASVGEFYRTIAAGLADGTVSQGLANLLRSGHKMEFPGLADGGRVLKTGLAVVHEGETYSGVGRSLGGGDELHVHFNAPIYGGSARRVADELADAIHASLLRKQQRNGGRLGLK